MHVSPECREQQGIARHGFDPHVLAMKAGFAAFCDGIEKNDERELTLQHGDTQIGRIDSAWLSPGNGARPR